MIVLWMVLIVSGLLWIVCLGCFGLYLSIVFGRFWIGLDCSWIVFGLCVDCSVFWHCLGLVLEVFFALLLDCSGSCWCLMPLANAKKQLMIVDCPSDCFWIVFDCFRLFLIVLLVVWLSVGLCELSSGIVSDCYGLPKTIEKQFQRTVRTTKKQSNNQKPITNNHKQSRTIKNNLEQTKNNLKMIGDSPLDSFWIVSGCFWLVLFVLGCCDCFWLPLNNLRRCQSNKDSQNNKETIKNNQKQSKKI